MRGRPGGLGESQRHPDRRGDQRQEQTDESAAAAGQAEAAPETAAEAAAPGRAGAALVADLAGVQLGVVVELHIAIFLDEMPRPAPTRGRAVTTAGGERMEIRTLTH